MSPKRIRGVLTSLPQFAITFGLVSGFFMCYGTSRISGSSASWRLPLGVGAVLAFGFAALQALVPPSPRWLLAKGRVDQARAVAEQLGLGAAEGDELLSQSNPALEQAANQSVAESLRHILREFREAFAAPYRSRTAFCCFIMAMQQFTGIDGILYYAPILMSQAGLSSAEAAFLASGVSALVILATTIPATLLADRWGPPHVVASGRRSDHRPDAPDGLAVCRQRGARHHRRREVGRHRVNLPVRRGIQCHLGHRIPRLRGREPPQQD